MSSPPDSPTPRSTEPPPPEDPALINALRQHGAGQLVFGRFRLLRELGKGGMGVVWLAHDERLGLEVALKFLPGMVASDPEALHDLRKEITRCLRLTHDRIVRVYDLHEDANEGLAAIAMEYVDGTTLADEKVRQPDRCFDVDEPLISWVHQLCDVLSFVHGKNVIHRDLKPRNIMLTTQGSIKVTDFGIAVTMSETQSRMTHLPGNSGTPLYMSPQQASAEIPQISDDVYAVGATLYELLSSKPPFFGGAPSAILNAVSSQVPPPISVRRMELGIAGRPSIPEAWEQTIAACLAKLPEDRPASCVDLYERLFSASYSEEPVAMAEAGSSCDEGDDGVAQAISAPSSRRLRRWFIYALALAIVLVLGGALYLGRYRRAVVDDQGNATPQETTPPAAGASPSRPKTTEGKAGGKQKSKAGTKSEKHK